MTFFIICCLLTGALAGFLAGLFGIGGGLVIVPVLVYLLPQIGIPEALLMNVALGTSFATIVITAFSSAQRHHKLGNVHWQAAKYLIPALMISVFIAGLFVSYLPKSVTSKMFAVMVLYLAIKMLLSIKHQTGNKPLNAKNGIIGGVLIGTVSSFAGIAGGAFIVPFLNARGLEMKQAIGTSSFCGMLLGMSGMISFAVSGWGVEGLPPYSLGYVYLPAVLLITTVSFFTSKFGATLTTTLPVPTLKKAFALWLCLVAVKMFIG
ncbi:sulfite exporter TauE/SafE family protein [Testudinibacter sp. P80/BLE/0925]|uniref:sulfite exporter TauE/SafE family protein n=1 Tax=Testudinibacter sp. TW-1 TaxID=3417757 RepID=UPI003D36C2E2